MELAQKKLFCQVVGQVIIADAEVTDSEHDFLESLMTRFGLSEADKQSVVDTIATGANVDEAVAGLSAELKERLIEDLIAAATVDGVLAGSEASIIQAVKDALGDGSGS